MRVLVYKRTHEGDPDPDTGCFGCFDCMGQVRGWEYDAVIGVGGVGLEPQRVGIAGRVTWIGISPRKQDSDKSGPDVWFDHFLYYGTRGPDFMQVAPHLGRRMYSRNIRAVMDKLSEIERAEVAKIVAKAKSAPPSPGLTIPRSRTSSVTRCKPIRHKSGIC